MKLVFLTCAGISLGLDCSISLAQITPSVRLRQGANGVLNDVAPTITTRMTNCTSIGLPYGVGAVEIRENPDDNWDVSIDINWTNDPTEIITSICGLSPLCPVPPIDNCGPEILQRIDYHSVRGGISAYVAAAGGGFTGGASFRRIATGTIVVNDVLEITSPEATTLELPILAAGDVFGAESFGNPEETWGRAKLEVTGTAAGESINLRCSVDSISVIPEQASINITRSVPLAVSAGVNLFPISLVALAEVDTKATSAGLFGTITGAATAGASFGNSLRILRITGAGGAPLPPNVIIRGVTTGVVYEDTRPQCLGDFNRDDAVDGDDIIAFFGQWDAGSIDADVNQDGGVDGDDVILFFSRWDAGC